MNEQLKKRLVGAIVLVALAVIFVPMLLEGDKRTDIPMFGSNVPEAPENRPDMVDIPLQVPPPPAYAPVVVERELPPEPVAVAPAPSAPELAPVPAPVSQAQSKPVAPVQAVKPAAVAATTKPAAGESWAVQVGSFSEQANASRLRDSLRGKGYPAYVEQVKLASGTSYRVRVGPVLARADAEAIQAKLAKIEQRGIVVPHP